MWGGPPGPQPTPTSASAGSASETMGIRRGRGRRPTAEICGELQIQDSSNALQIHGSANLREC